MDLAADLYPQNLVYITASSLVAIFIKNDFEFIQVLFFMFLFKNQDGSVP